MVSHELLTQINSVTLDVNIETTAFLWMLTVFNPCTASNNSNLAICDFSYYYSCIFCCCDYFISTVLTVS
ncbi:hypothetical protein D4764_0012680 [Takifugu flavidus]|uniref:Uncharacterized protein n=1 Tax=Takifugu flavidus TaxID=433684 RepID=A0A5C6MIJ4_9TELE|nr:hypothetical protein D4764_0012680 [Takifugu flavidus]